MFEAMKQKYLMGKKHKFGEGGFHEKKKHKHKKKKKKKKRKKRKKHKHKYPSHEIHYIHDHDDGGYKSKYQKFLVPLLLAYKLKFFTLIPVFIGKYIDEYLKKTNPMNTVKTYSKSMISLLISLAKSLLSGLLSTINAIEDYIAGSVPKDPTKLIPDSLKDIISQISGTIGLEHRDEESETSSTVNKIMSEILGGSSPSDLGSFISSFLSPSALLSNPIKDLKKPTINEIFHKIIKLLPSKISKKVKKKSSFWSNWRK
jgi:hypothetical protein